MASNLRVDTILPSTGTTLGIGTASGTINFLGNSSINTTGVVTATTIKVGAAISMTDNAISATRFHGDGSQLTGISVDTTKIETGNTKVETIDTGSDGHIKFTTEGTARSRIDVNGHFTPEADNTYDLGTSSLRWRDIYTGDLNLSNEGRTNDVDGTWGNYTIQEGESDLFLINNRTGKKYKFLLQEVD
jgi:hypothetical protein